eukprot:CAMPEP_0184517848 /NCGR_PEP_ID=MMETSP0198_2-20121128/5776_1 /TAXON_ID=1112570 /ORGANISM="Thraustochytrium sp., Strain LLF1b" /LENGTH=76 /DNA_ID=CAMNT_0026908253 /DNA_START=839 /DNA_END=1066 /DNA_ORIENTATION=+
MAQSGTIRLDVRPAARRLRPLRQSELQVHPSPMPLQVHFVAGGGLAAHQRLQHLAPAPPPRASACRDLRPPATNTL